MVQVRGETSIAFVVIMGVAYRRPSDGDGCRKSCARARAVESDFRQVGEPPRERKNERVAHELVPDTDGRSRRVQRWRAVAAYVTWLALSIHVGARLLTCDALSRAQMIGLAAFIVCLAVGNYQLRRPLGGGPHPGFRALTVVQTIAALMAARLLNIDTLAILLIVIVAQIAEREGTLFIVGWMLAADSALAAIYLEQFSLVGTAIRVGLQVGFQVFTVSVSLALAETRRAKDALAGLNAELMATRRLLRESTRSQERLRISRELHDVAGHRLTALKLNLESALRPRSDPAAIPEALRDRLTLCRDLTGELLDDIRSVVHQLRATDGVDLRRALEPLTHQLPDTQVDLDISEQLSISRIDVAEAIIRCAQESITNALKHGRARHVRIAVAHVDERVELTVQDDGGGGPTGAPGHGILGMRERAARLGGSLEISGAPRRGWQVRLVVPVGE